MVPIDISKSTTRQISILEPEEEELEKQLAGRDLSPGLRQFLRNLIKGKKWSRKINIPSSHENLAAALVFSSELKKAGLEISSELHVFFEDKVLIEKWPVVKETDKISALPKETFAYHEIEKVRLDGAQSVKVEIKIPVPGGKSRTVVRSFDFAGDSPKVRVVAHPLLDE